MSVTWRSFGTRSFSPSRGLTAITGETGAGKTALLSACKLLVGERADKAAVREGSDRLSVEGRLFFDNAADIPEGVELEDGEAVVCRRVSIDGRSRASVNGHMASAKEIARLVAPTLDLCSQHEHQALMRPATHLSLLDAWAKDSISEAHANYLSAFEAAKRAADELSRVKAAGEAFERRGSTRPASRSSASIRSAFPMKGNTRSSPRVSRRRKTPNRSFLQRTAPTNRFRARGAPSMRSMRRQTRSKVRRRTTRRLRI